jgi:4'-phosphopantetheinyl transferase
MERIAIDRVASDATIALVDLDVSAGDLAKYAGWLDIEERGRAARFRHARDRDRFIARRGQLRGLLAHDLSIAPAELRLAADYSGKPILLDDPDLAFNLSHSNGRALIATARGQAIGCDIEWRNRELACPRVAERLFAPEEYSALIALPPEHWIAGFYNCWTRKEAYVKALGLGLSYPLDAFTVSVAPGEPARFTSDEPGWSLTSFEPAPGFQAALVTWIGPSPAR